MTRLRLAAAILILALVSLVIAYVQRPPDPWTEDELNLIQSLALYTLPPLGGDPTNPVADSTQAAILGHTIFFDTRFSATAGVACSTCHQPALNFTDGRVVSLAIGQAKRNAPSIIGTAYSPWLYWDGRKDSLWSQALAPLEDPDEHGGDRLQFAHIVYADPDYRKTYEMLFGPMPNLANRQRFPIGARAAPQPNSLWLAMDEADRVAVNAVFANLGRAIAAYERLLLPGFSRFDQYALALREGYDPNYTRLEKRGLDLFINQANCTQCHNGPLFTNNAFHNTGLLSRPGHLPDTGRIGAIDSLQSDPFNCLGQYAADTRQQADPVNPQQRCAELIFMGTGKTLVGAFRTPSLRNLAKTQPYGHAGQFENLKSVLQHYNNAPDAMIGHNEAKPLNLWPWELNALEAFLLSLQAPPEVAPRWMNPPAG